MPKRKGSPKTGGRKKGTPNKVNAYNRGQAWAYCHAVGYNPIKSLVDLALGKKPPGSSEVSVLELIQIHRELLKYLMTPIKAMEPDTGTFGADITVVIPEYDTDTSEIEAAPDDTPP